MLPGLDARPLKKEFKRYVTLSFTPFMRLFLAALNASAARLILGAAPRATRINVASASTLDLTTNAPDTDDVQLTGTASITLVNLAIGRVVRFVVGVGGNPSFVNSAAIRTQTGGTVQFSENDTFMLRATAANVVEILMLPVLSGTITPAKLSGNQTGLAPAFAARAFCTFNGATTGSYSPTLPSGNISSIAKNGTGLYTFTFTTAMVDAEYAVTFGGDGCPTMGIAQSLFPMMGIISKTSGAVQVQFYAYAGASNLPTAIDPIRGHIVISR